MLATSSQAFTMFSKPGCVQCKATLRHFGSKGLVEDRVFYADRRNLRP